MCSRNTKLFISLFISVIISVVLGVLAGVFSASVFASPSIFFRITLLISSVVLLVYTSLLYSRSNRPCPSNTALKIIISYLLFGVIGAFISSVIGLTLLVPAGSALSILLGFSAFFTLIDVGAVIIQFYYLLNNNITGK